MGYYPLIGTNEHSHDYVNSNTNTGATGGGHGNNYPFTRPNEHSDDHLNTNSGGGGQDNFNNDRTGEYIGVRIKESELKIRYRCSFGVRRSKDL
jgi:hypothetical protein